MKKFLSLVLALIMTMSLVTVSAGAADFTDADSIDYDTAIDVMKAVKVIDGYPDGSFNPNGTLSRGAAAKIICNLILGPTTADALVATAAPFKDVPVNHTFAGYIAYCANEGIVGGYADGTFQPAATLTGYAFMKMLLGALGYDAEIEGYAQPNWGVAVAKRAINIGLEDGLVGEFNGSKAVTRQEACLYAFNAMQADIVTYDGKSTVTAGNITITTQVEPKTVTTTQAYAEKIIDEEGSTNTVQFAEEFFKKLSCTPSQSDKNGRPASTWKYDGKFVAYELATLDATYTAATKQTVIATDLDLDADATFYYYVDGVGAVSEEYKIVLDEDNTANWGLTAAGKIVELYEDVNGLNYAVVINPAIEKIVSVKTDREGRYVTTDAAETFYTDLFEVDDVVEVYYGYDSEAVITEMQLAKKVAGTVTKKTGTTSWVVDGTTYKLSKSAKASIASPTVDTKASFWVDSNGYIVETDSTTTSYNVSDLALVIGKGADGLSDRVRLLKADGKKETLEVEADSFAAAKMDGSAYTLVKFELDDGEYELQDATTFYKTSGETAYYFTSGTTAITEGTGADKDSANASVLKVDGATTFVYVDKADGSAKVYTGYKNAPTFASADIMAYCKQNDVTKTAILVYVFVNDVDVTGSTSNVMFFVPKAEGSFFTKVEEVDVKDYYAVNAIVNGEWTTVNVEAGSDADADGIAFYTSAGISAVKELKTNSDGQVKAVTAADYVVSFVANATTDDILNDVVTINGVGYAYDDNTVVYFVAKTRDGMTTGTVADIREDNNSGKQLYTNSLVVTDKNGVLDYVVLVMA